jgi:hypothetical protein
MGGEWEPIKIPLVDLAYIPKWTKDTSLLTQSRLRSYRIATSPQRQVRNWNHSDSKTRCKQNTNETMKNQNLIKKASHNLTNISSNTLWT